MERHGILLFSALLLSAQGLDAQPSAPRDGEPRRATAVAERTLDGIQLDGLADEPVWRSALAVSGFRQYDPAPDAEPSERTEFRVAFDQDNLYLFVRAFDSHADSIMHALSRRDVRGPSDQIGVLIDSYNDRRTGFAFYVNPDGVKRDFAVYDDGNQDGSWSGVWEAATRVDSLGWTAEFRIPLSQLRYSDSQTHTFGFGVRREISGTTSGRAGPCTARPPQASCPSSASSKGCTASLRLGAWS
ncbi:MAG: carbohydrate binding family 9 domain-containing protein [Longimicrobiales bacterium]|nr:carbohydrate binding family 9 domain-containing protein [Longimicrobiales bacterium]